MWTPREAYLISLLNCVPATTVWGLAVEGVLENPTAELLDRLLDQLASQYRDNPASMTGILGDELAAFIVFHRRQVVNAPIPPPTHVLRDLRTLPVDAEFAMAPGGQALKVVDRKRNVTHYEEVRDGVGRRARARHYHNRGPLKVYIVNQQTPAI